MSKNTTQEPTMTLIDGERYWLGATYGIYRADGDYFLLGNCWVARSSTIFA